MRTNWAYALAAVACLSLAACNKTDKTVSAKGPAGQVVATVDGQEVTLRELRAELGAATFPDAKTRKAAEIQALQSIVSRRLLVKAAQERGLDKTPDYELQKERVMDAALVQELQNSIAKAVPAASREEAERYVIEHPDLFAQRKIYVVDQIRAQPLKPEVLEALKPLNTLEEVETLFNQQNVAYDRSVGKIDAAVSDPRLIAAIVALKPGDVFAIPIGQVIVINRVKETKVQPYTGDAAVAYAQQRLSREHVQEAVMREYNAILAKAKDKVQYNKDYQPGGKVAEAGAAPAPAPSAAGNGG